MQKRPETPGAVVLAGNNILELTELNVEYT